MSVRGTHNYYYHTTDAQCAHTALWLNEMQARDMCSDPIGQQKDISDIVFPVVIRGDYTSTNYNVYELSSLLRYVMWSGKFISPTTKKAFKLHELEAVRYPGFKGYAATVEELQSITGGEWSEKQDPAAEGTPKNEDGARMNRVWVRENDSEEEEDRAQQRKIIDEIWATRFLTMRNMASELRQVMDRTGPYGGWNGYCQTCLQYMPIV